MQLWWLAWKIFLGCSPEKRRCKGGGRRKPEDQNAYDAVISSLVSKELDAAKLTKMLSHKFDINKRQIKWGRALGKNLKDMDSKRWIRKSSTVSCNAICSGRVSHFLCTSFSCAYFHACIDFFALQTIVQQYRSSCTPMNAVEQIIQTRCLLLLIWEHVLRLAPGYMIFMSVASYCTVTARYYVS